jgi:hypothetical protein
MLNLPETFAEAAALDAHIAEVQEQRRKATRKIKCYV